MSTEHVILFLVIGIVAGFLAGKIMKGSGYGLFGDLVVGKAAPLPQYRRHSAIG